MIDSAGGVSFSAVLRPSAQRSFRKGLFYTTAPHTDRQSRTNELTTPTSKPTDDSQQQTADMAAPAARGRAQLAMSRVCRVANAHRPAPALFYYPGLTSRPWHERTASWATPWVSQLEAATPAITSEFLNLLESGRQSGWPQEARDSGGRRDGLTLVDRGRRQLDVWDRCPATAAALRAIPQLCVGAMPFAFAFFSTLRPNCAISPHHAPCNLRLRVHLPLLAARPPPAGQRVVCGMRVAGESRAWRPGEVLIFDDSFEHEVWNESGVDRAVLLFDLWHWELADGERASIEAMFEEIQTNRSGR